MIGSVVIDVDQLLHDRALEAQEFDTPPTPVSNPKKHKAPKSVKQRAIVKSEEFDSVMIPSVSQPHRKRKSEGGGDSTRPKKIRVKSSSAKTSGLTSSTPSTSISTLGPGAPPPKPPMPRISVTLKLPPRPAEPEVFPCCLCISQDCDELLRVYDPPVGRKDAMEATGNPKIWMAHDQCAKIVPETWVDEVDNGSGIKGRMVFGVDGLVKDRWNLVSFFFWISPHHWLTLARNVHHARGLNQKVTGRLFSVRRGNVRRHSTFHVPGKTP